MKVLFVSPVPTDPPDAGNRVRILTLANAVVAGGHEVHFAYVPMEPFDQDAMARRFGPQRFTVLPWRVDAKRENLLLRIGRKLGRRLQIDAAFMHGLDDWYDGALNETLATLHREHAFDAVFVEYVFMSAAFDAFAPPCLRVLDTHDRFGLRHRNYLEAGMRPRWYSTSLADEERGFRRADVVLAINPDEARDFGTRIAGSRTRVLHVGHLIDMPPPARPSRREAAVFVGSSNPINVVGVRHFIDRVLPIVRRARPGFDLLLAGTVAAEVEATDGVVKLGFVPKLHDAFAAAMLAVNPVRAGTGVNIKLLDAMAAAMPIVTTKSGARGVEQFAGQALVVVEDDDDEGFAQHILTLLADETARSRLAAGARASADRWNAEQVSTLAAALSRPSAATRASSGAKAPESLAPAHMGRS